MRYVVRRRDCLAAKPKYEQRFTGPIHVNAQEVAGKQRDYMSKKTLHWVDDSPHYEEKFEFPMMKLIRERAREKDCSILKALQEVVPEYALKLRFRDAEYNEEMFRQQQKQREAVSAKGPGR